MIDAIPDSALASFQDELGERAVNEPGALIQNFIINVNAEHWKMDEEGRARRAALSRAINRKQICDTLFYDTRTPRIGLHQSHHSRVEGLRGGQRGPPVR